MQECERSQRQASLTGAELWSNMTHKNRFRLQPPWRTKVFVWLLKAGFSLSFWLCNPFKRHSVRIRQWISNISTAQKVLLRLKMRVELQTQLISFSFLPSTGPDSEDRGKLHHRAQRDHRGWRGCGGRGEDKTLHRAERIARSLALVAGELHRGLELLCWSVGECQVE